MLARTRKVTDSGDSGASAVEYGLLVAAIAAAVVIIVFLLGDVVTEVFQSTCDDISTEADTTADCAPAPADG